MANGYRRNTRGRGARLSQTIVVVLAVALLLIGKTQNRMLDRARAGVTDWMSPFLETVAAPVDGIGRWFHSIGDIFVVYQENLRLQEEKARLMQWQSKARVLEERIKSYQALLHAVPDPELGRKVARIIGRASHPFMRMMILNAGKRDGILPGQAVVDERGMIGRIFLTGERTSWVIPLTDLNSRIPVTVEPSKVQAIMAGDNSPMPQLNALALGAAIKAGDQVITSGDGDILPAGLLIGVVVPHGKDLRVALFADQYMAQDVEILNFKVPLEKPPTPTMSDLPVTAAGLPPVPPAPPPVPAPLPAKPTVILPAKPAVGKLPAANAPDADADTDGGVE